MKLFSFPATCSIALSAMLAAATSHWWSIRQFSQALDHRLASSVDQNRNTPLPIATPPAQPLLVPPPPPQAAISPINDKHQKAFYEALLEKMSRMESQNRDLLDQLAETNRDIMKLEFRVDTHSESFRPLPVAEEPPYSQVDQESGVLPAR